MKDNLHIIRNFPKNYPLWRKVGANLIFFFSIAVIRWRKNYLNQKDLRNAKHHLRRGDIVLVGGLRKLSCLIISGPLTHSLLYIGSNQFIHSVADGVEKTNITELFEEYDTMMILRSNTQSKEKIDMAIEFARKQIGKPFDFYFTPGREKLYCSELVYFAFEHAKVDVKIFDDKKYEDSGGLIPGIKAIHPMEYIYGDFNIVFKSHNLEIKNKKVQLIKEFT